MTTPGDPRTCAGPVQAGPVQGGRQAIGRLGICLLKNLATSLGKWVPGRVHGHLLLEPEILEKY